jgi:hypothetical protein
VGLFVDWMSFPVGGALEPADGGELEVLGEDVGNLVDPDVVLEIVELADDAVFLALRYESI